MSLLIRTMALFRKLQNEIGTLDTMSVGVKDLTPPNENHLVIANNPLCYKSTNQVESTVKVFFAELFYGDNALSCPAAIINCDTVIRD